MSRLGAIGHRLYTGEISLDFVGRWRRWFLMSAAIIVIAVGAVGIRGLNFSIDFRGGVDIEVPIANPTSHIEQARAAVTGTGIPNASEPIVVGLGNDKLQVQTGTLTPTETATVRKAVAQAVNVSQSKVAYSSIGPSWGKQISQKAIISLIVFVGLVMLVIWAYFREPKMSIAAIAALMHDLVVTVGIYALVGFEVAPETVVGVLTILGYSLYDTVVVFDKVRENSKGLAAGARMTYSESANLAVNQTLVRSINTSVTALLPVAGILFVGAGVLGVGALEDLALALFIGIAAGTYSSIFIATPLAALMKEREPAMKALAKRVANRRAQAASAVTGRGPNVAVAGGAASRSGATPASNAARAGRTAPGTGPLGRPTASGPTGEPGIADTHPAGSGEPDRPDRLGQGFSPAVPRRQPDRRRSRAQRRGRTDPGRTDPGRRDPGRPDPGRPDPGRPDPGQQRGQQT
jgi:preprotein translocase subunit SecF